MKKKVQGRLFPDFYYLQVIILLISSQGLLCCTDALEQNKPMQNFPECIEKFENLNQIRSELQEQGQVRVIVSMDVDFTPEGKLSGDEISKQRKNIAVAQDKLIATLQIPRESVIGRMSTLPFMIFLVSGKELSQLSCNPLVKSIGHDKAIRIKR